MYPLRRLEHVRMYARTQAILTDCAESCVCKVLTCSILLQHYLDSDQKLKRFVPIIQDAVVYPVVLDSKRTILSLPPIINGSVSQVRLSQYHAIYTQAGRPFVPSTRTRYVAHLGIGSTRTLGSVNKRRPSLICRSPLKDLATGAIIVGPVATDAAIT